MSVVCHEEELFDLMPMLIHQMSSGFWGKMEEIKDEFINLKKLTKNLKGIYKAHTKLRNRSKDKSDDNDTIRLKDDILKRDLWWRIAMSVSNMV